MSLPNAAFIGETDPYPTDGFTFGVLAGAPNADNTTPIRTQTNPKFTRDYNNNEFEADTPYYFTAYHPQYMPSQEMITIVFDAAGGFRQVGGTGTTAIVNIPSAGSNLRFEADDDYDVLTLDMTITVVCLVQPDLKLEGLGTSLTGWQTAQPVEGQPNTYRLVFPSVNASGRLFVRASGTTGEGSSVPIRIPSIDYTPLSYLEL
ncbi:hypothetical protein GCM10028807_57700 [Spirosoma daeguense]